MKANDLIQDILGISQDNKSNFVDEYKKMIISHLAYYHFCMNYGSFIIFFILIFNAMDGFC